MIRYFREIFMQIKFIQKTIQNGAIIKFKNVHVKFKTIINFNLFFFMNWFRDHALISKKKKTTLFIFFH